MNIQENDKVLFSNVVKKYNLKREGFLSRFFKSTLNKSLAKDKSLDKAIKDGDRALADLKKSAEVIKRKGLKVSPATKKAAAEFGIKL